MLQKKITRLVAETWPIDSRLGWKILGENKPNIKIMEVTKGHIRILILALLAIFTRINHTLQIIAKITVVTLKNSGGAALFE